MAAEEQEAIISKVGNYLRRQGVPQALQTQAEQAGQTESAQFKKMKAKLLKSQQIAERSRVELEQNRAKLEQDKAGIQAGIDRTLAERSERMAQDMQQQLHSVHQSLHGQAKSIIVKPVPVKRLSTLQHLDSAGRLNLLYPLQQIP